MQIAQTLPRSRQNIAGLALALSLAAGLGAVTGYAVKGLPVSVAKAVPAATATPVFHWIPAGPPPGVNMQAPQRGLYVQAGRPASVYSSSQGSAAREADGSRVRVTLR